MVRALALLLLLCCACQGAVDAVWCPDGCDSAVSQTATVPQTSTSGVCLFCGTGFVVDGAVIIEDPPTHVSTAVGVTEFDILVPLESAAIDHPPRTR